MKNTEHKLFILYKLRIPFLGKCYVSDEFVIFRIIYLLFLLTFLLSYDIMLEVKQSVPERKEPETVSARTVKG